MQVYNDYQCYNFYRSIENAEAFLEKIRDGKPFLEKEGIEYIYKIKITSEKALKGKKRSH